MRYANCKRRISLAGTVLVITLILLPHSVRGAGPTPPPGRPPNLPLPPGPCISTGLLFNSPFVFCTVRNAGTVPHNVTIDVRDDRNFSLSYRGNATESLDPGTSNGIIATPPAGMVACVVTTDEGTPDALKDLSVVLFNSGGDNGSPTADTAGQIFQKCAPSNGPSSG